ncbi:TetR/AcrR family transcriptional regulator [Actinoplanes sp. TBRC 11911]|uniref:TetR family transcriptional regulator n=1 Tax=Actinoplanes sp. TBRC 11911 TaxID=2729386 RepID=UPI00145C5D36|nr:TetR family transcriptional regulator [Actinoplanes sp. TBRC 11911]NMO51833.1 TetR/AcrR family transcriptional regulator [Actinoplanes sp. TBRC 11911]
MAYQRARSPERKRERTEALIEGARRVAARDGVHRVTLAAMAEEAGLTHSAVLRYFHSRNEVLLRLAGQGWTAWADRLEAALTRTDTDGLAKIMVATLVADPLFCDLLGNVPLHLEHDLPREIVRSFKRTGNAALRRIVAAIDAAVPALDAAAAADLMSATNALAGTLWQVCHPDPTLAEIYREEPALGHLPDDFAPLLERLIGATAKGLK